MSRTFNWYIFEINHPIFKRQAMDQGVINDLITTDIWKLVYSLRPPNLAGQLDLYFCASYAFTLYRNRYAVTALGTGFCVWRRRPGLIETFAMRSKHETQLLPVYPSNLADLSNDTNTGITTTSDCCCYRIIFINYPHLSYTVIITFFSSIFFWVT